MTQEPETIVADKYRLLEPLGAGGMGTLWVAEHLGLGTKVALKRIRDWEGGSDAFLRFQREARAAASLRSRNIVRVHDFGGDGGGPYIVMELLEGLSLTEHIYRAAPLSPAEAGRWLQQICRALATAHAAGIVHRDIKPSNLFLANEEGEQILKVLDFGIAKQLRTAHDSVTISGALLGSPGYMSPEQARGLPVDARTDLFSVAAVLYEMLTNHAPFLSEHPGDCIARVCAGSFPRVTSLVPNLPAALDPFFERALHQKPEQRFAEARELERAYQTAIGAFGGTREVGAMVSAVPAASEDRGGEEPALGRGLQAPRGRTSTTRIVEPAAAETVGSGIALTPSRPARRRSAPLLAAASVLATLVAGVYWFAVREPVPHTPEAAVEAAEPPPVPAPLSSATPASTPPEPEPAKSAPESKTKPAVAPAPVSKAAPRPTSSPSPSPRPVNVKPVPAKELQPKAPSPSPSKPVRRDPFTGLPLGEGS